MTPPRRSQRRRIELRTIIGAYLLLVAVVATPIIWWFETATADALVDQALEGMTEAERIMGRQIEGRAMAAIHSLERFSVRVSEVGASNVGRAREFDALVGLDDDGARRSLMEKFEAGVEAGIWLSQGAELDDGWRDFYVRARELTSTFGSGALDEVVVNTWVLPKNRGEVIYWPDNPGFIYNARPQYDYLDTPWVTLVNPEQGADGSPRWTPTTYDVVGRTWLVSIVSAFQYRGAWGGSVGHDLPADRLLEFVASLAQREGTETLVATNEGLILVSSRFTAEIQASNGSLKLDDLPDATLRNAVREPFSTMSRRQHSGTLSFRGKDQVVLATHVKGPGWTILRIVPNDSITAAATKPLRGLRFILGLVFGTAALIIFLSIYREVRGRQLAEVAGAEREALVEQLVSRSPGLVAIKDKQGRYLFASEALARLVRKSRGELIGSHDSDIFPSELAATIGAAEMEALTRGPLAPCEETWTLADGEHTIIAIRFPLVGPEGSTFATGFIGTDVTERRSLEERLRESEKLQAIGRLAGGIAHDFNNVMTAIIGFAELIEVTFAKDDPRLGDVNEIKVAGRRAAELSTQLLTFARRQPVAPRKVDVASTLAELHRMLDHLIGDDIVLDTRTEDDLPRILIDPAQFQQLIMNLVVNARDAMPLGGRLEITARRTLAAGKPCVLIRVSDTGAGMSAGIAARAFEPFFTTKGLGQGTGLGLATCYGVVKTAGGEITIQSREGEGTTFTVLLPAATADDESAITMPAIPESSPRSLTVLLVEDERPVRDALSRGLATFGFRVVTAANGGEALGRFAAATEPIDIVVSDVMMPGIDGPEFVKKLRELRADQPVLFISGYGNNDAMDNRALPPHTWMLTKPFTTTRLTERIREILRA